jgi:peptide/nickel transport system permease protein
VLKLVWRRILLSLLTLFLVSIIVFAATEVLPGDVATAVLGREATPEAVESLRQELGLDEPAVQRYREWLQGLLTGDLGQSLSRDEPIADVVVVRLRNTVILATVAALIGIPVALALGIVAGARRDSVLDVVVSIVALVTMSLPEFVVGTILILVFSLWLGLVPAVTTVDPDASIGALLPNVWLPALTLAIVMIGWIVRMMRTCLIESLDSDYVRMATLRGLSRRRIVLAHAVPNALLPTISVIALTVAWLIGGVVIVEAVFNYPGIGTLTVEAVQNRDLPLVQAVTLIGAATFVLVNLFADLLMLAANPRLRTMRT